MLTSSIFSIPSIGVMNSLKALWTQNLLKDNNIDFFGNDEWPGNSPDLNACASAGSILKDEVEKRMLSEPLATRYSPTKMEKHITAVLRGMEFNTELFESLLSSYPARLQAVRDTNEGNTEYWAYEHRPIIKCATYRCFHFFPIMLSLLWGRRGGGGVYHSLAPLTCLVYDKL